MSASTAPSIAVVGRRANRWRCISSTAPRCRTKACPRSGATTALRDAWSTSTRTSTASCSSSGWRPRLPPSTVRTTLRRPYRHPPSTGRQPRPPSGTGAPGLSNRSTQQNPKASRRPSSRLWSRCRRSARASRPSRPPCVAGSGDGASSSASSRSRRPWWPGSSSRAGVRTHGTTHGRRRAGRPRPLHRRPVSPPVSGRPRTHPPRPTRSRRQRECSPVDPTVSPSPNRPASTTSTSGGRQRSTTTSRFSRAARRIRSTGSVVPGAWPTTSAVPCSSRTRSERPPPETANRPPSSW